MLEKREKVLLKKVAAEVERAKEFTRAKNKRGMLLHAFVVSSLCIICPSYGIHLCYRWYCWHNFSRYAFSWECCSFYPQPQAYKIFHSSFYIPKTMCYLCPMLLFMHLWLALTTCPMINIVGNSPMYITLGAEVRVITSRVGIPSTLVHCLSWKTLLGGVDWF